MDAILAIITVNYGSSSLLETNLALTSRARPDALVIVVDNYSDADESEAIAAVCRRHGWHLVPMDENVGFGAGMNQGAARAFELGATDVLLINPDAHIDAESIDALQRSVLVDEPSAASPVVKDPSGRVWSAGVDLYLADGTMRNPRRRPEHVGEDRLFWLSGACMWVRRRDWELIGGFDPEYFLYWEDVDFSARLVAAGVRLSVVEAATAIHDEGGTHRADHQRVEAKSGVYYYYNIRNRMLFAARHLGPSSVENWRRTSIRAAKDILLRGGRRQFLRPVAPMLAAFRGLRDGRRIARAVRVRDEPV